MFLPACREILLLNSSLPGIVFLIFPQNTVVPGNVRVTSLSLVSDLNVTKWLIFRIDFIFDKTVSV